MTVKRRTKNEMRKKKGNERTEKEGNILKKKEKVLRRGGRGGERVYEGQEED